MKTDTLGQTLALLAAIAVLWLAASSPVAARKARTAIIELSAGSDAFAVAHVDRVVSHGGMKIAVATVIRPIKGLNANQQFSFLAEPTWACDSSDAVPGETVLLFLERPGDGFDNWLIETHPQAWERRAHHPARPFFKIAHSGSGRMEITDASASEYLEGREGPSLAPGRPESVWVGDVEIPPALLPAGSRGSAWDYSLVRGPRGRVLILLDAVEQYLRQATGYRSAVLAEVLDPAGHLSTDTPDPSPPNRGLQLLGWMAAASTCAAASLSLLTRVLRALPSVRR